MCVCVGVSNFNTQELQELYAWAKVKPQVLQVCVLCLHQHTRVKERLRCACACIHHVCVCACVCVFSQVHMDPLGQSRDLQAMCRKLGIQVGTGINPPSHTHTALGVRIHDKMIGA